MTIFRRILTGSALAVLATGLASADTLISFTVTIPATATDLTNVQNLVTSWDPGGTGTYNTTASDTTSFYSGQTGFATGITMAGLNAANTTYNLQSYDIYVAANLVGSYDATAGGSGAVGSVHVDSYTGVALGSALSPALTPSADSTNDLFNTGNSPLANGGPDPIKATAVNLGAGASTGTIGYNKTQGSDYGCVLANGPTACITYTPQSSGLGTVTGTSPLDFYLSTATETVAALTSGNVTFTNSQTVAETITVVYDC